MIEEVRQLLDKGVSEEFLYNMGLEYRSVLLHLRGDLATRNDLIAHLERAIRQFAKRQMTWFRGMTDVVWIAGGPDILTSAAAHVQSFLRSPPQP
jgi:tRNA dimethylallyltransferase